MKQYNLLSHRQEREMSFGKLTILALGERGRGRYESIIPFASTISENDFVDIAPTKSGKTKIIPSSKKENWLAVLDAEGCYTRNTLGDIYVPENQKNNVKIIAKGNGAYGDAGRIGDWYAYLTFIKDGTFIWVRPSGGSHKRERYWIYFDHEKAFQLSEEELPIFCDTNNLDLPNSEHLISLSNC